SPICGIFPGRGPEDVRRACQRPGRSWRPLTSSPRSSSGAAASLAASGTGSVQEPELGHAASGAAEGIVAEAEEPLPRSELGRLWSPRASCSDRVSNPESPRAPEPGTSGGQLLARWQAPIDAV